ncbi:MAG: glycerol-3-phosphate dehydrogenase [Thermoleophilaceae bacterium]|jgi:1-acyl-sn-glycerol-3-phosphate acyltransferase|nr:glycerol-3-phosphate dehydrogenase [Thermoleophilaceae bacterium]
MSETVPHRPGLERHHERVRGRGVNRPVYWLVRAILQPAILIWFRLDRQGRDHIPRTGPVILAANHRSFLDPFIVGVCLRRPVYFVAKQELFARRWQGWLLNALGAFPIRRGESDEQAVETSKAILARGDAVVIFPEGTRIRTGALGNPKRGVGRLALETGAPVVPIAVAGTERARRGWRIRPVKIRVRCGRPLTFPRLEAASPSLAAEVTARIWPCVELQWEWLGGLPAMHKAAVVGAGEMGTAMAALLGRAGLDVQLGCRTLAQADRIAAAHRNPDRLQHVGLPHSVTPCTVPEIELAGVDLLVLAVPLAARPAAIARIGHAIGPRTTVVLPVRGPLRADAELPERYLRERTRAAAIASIGVPAGATGLLDGDGAVELSCADPDRERQLAEVLKRADLRVGGETIEAPGIRRVA